MAGQAAALPRLAALAIAIIGMVAVVWRLGYVDAAITERMTQLGRRVFLRIRK
jgi:hypothetical protein